MADNIFIKFSKTDLGQKINDLFKSILLDAKASGGVVIFLSRKGYWLYQVYRRYGDWEKGLTDGVIVVSDRYVSKWFNPEWTGRSFYIVDDTVTTGLTMYHIYGQIRAYYNPSRIHCIAFFMRMTGFELQRMMESRLIGNEEQECLPDFLDSFETLDRVSVEQIGWLSYEEIYLFQKLLIPYVVDLPSVADENYSFEKQENEFNHRYSVCSGTWFTKLLRMQGDWVYEDNSYLWDNVLEGNTVSENIGCGYFRCIDSNIYSRVGDILFQIVVKCRYEMRDDGNLNVVFTPFAILNSMTCENAFAVCSVIFRETEFLSELINQGRMSSKDNERYNTLLLRSIVYFFSMYGWISFYKSMEETVGISTPMKIDLSYMSENSAEAFTKMAQEMRVWERDDFLQRLQGMETIQDILPVEIRGKEGTLIEDADSMQAYILLYCAILDRKRNNIRDAFTSIEELYGILGNSMVSQNEELRKTMFIHVLLQMLDQSVLGNGVKYCDGYIKRGFRSGENSDIALPFYNSYIYYGVANLYNRCIWKAVYRTEETRKLYFGKIHALFKGIRNMAIKNGYLGVLISEDELKYCEWYFSDERADLTTIVENKQFRLKTDRRIRAVERDIDFCMDELIHA